MDLLHSKNFYSTSQVAAILGVNRITIFRWIQNGSIKATKVGRTYVIAHDELTKHISEKGALNEQQKITINQLVNKTVHDYGETIRLLGRE